MRFLRFGFSSFSLFSKTRISSARLETGQNSSVRTFHGSRDVLVIRVGAGGLVRRELQQEDSVCLEGFEGEIRSKIKEEYHYECQEREGQLSLDRVGYRGATAKQDVDFLLYRAPHQRGRHDHYLHGTN